MTPRDLKDNFYHPTKIWVLPFLSYFLVFSKIDFAMKMAKERNFLYLADLSFDARFAKYQFSLNDHKQVSKK